jgi:hypothetical protein
VTRGTEDTVSLKLGNIWVRAQILDALFLCALGSTTLGWGLRESVCSGLGGVYSRRVLLWGWWLRTGKLVSIPVLGGKVVGVVSNRDGVATMSADNPARLVLWRG